MLQGELLEVDVVSTSGVVSGVFVVVEIGRSSGDHDEVTVEAKSMAPDEMAIMPFEVIGAVPSELPVAYALTGAKTDEPTPHSR